MSYAQSLLSLAVLLCVDNGGAERPPAQCRQFDFWVGDWDVHVRMPTGPGQDRWQEGQATNKITSRFDGHVIEEHFDGSHLPQPLTGMSVSVYNPKLEKWEQTWVDDQGSYIDLVGEFKDGKMILTHKVKPLGRKVIFRMVFEDIARDSFLWKWERSDDLGKSWLLRLQARYTRSKAKT